MCTIYIIDYNMIYFNYDIYDMSLCVLFVVYYQTCFTFCFVFSILYTLGYILFVIIHV